MILHLTTAAALVALAPGEPLVPASVAEEGFVHACDDAPTLLDVANRFYRGVPDELVVLEIDEALLTSPVVRERAAHPDGSPVVPGDPLFPHVYGPIDRAAIAAERPVRRGPDGAVLGW